MKKYSLFALLSLVMLGCHSLTGSRTVTELKPIPQNIYETVNSVPQFAEGEDHFLLYWAVWRTLSKEERNLLNGADSNLVSLRDIKWKMLDCVTGVVLNQNGERIWYLDKLHLDPEGLLLPIKEAPRKDYRYFSFLNLNSQHLRGVGPFQAPKKKRGESMADWDKRRGIARQEWLKKSWAKGTRGTLFVTVDHRFLAPNLSVEDEGWIDPKDYPKLTGDLLGKITQYSPNQWPIHFDERSHKPHLFNEPNVWTRSQEENQVVSQKLFRMKLEWNWCDTNQPVRINLLVPKGELPPPGPNRPGRIDSGTKVLTVTEVDWIEADF